MLYNKDIAKGNTFINVPLSNQDKMLCDTLDQLRGTCYTRTCEKKDRKNGIKHNLILSLKGIYNIFWYCKDHLLNLPIFLLLIRRLIVKADR